MISILIYLLIIILMVGLIYWVIDAVPLPQPMNKFAKIVVVVVGCIAVVYVLLNATGTDIGLPRR